MIKRKPKKLKLDHAVEELLANKCALCPLKEKKCSVDPDLDNSPPIDILIISPKLIYKFSESITGYKSMHVFLTECLAVGEEATDTTRMCCLGRKLEIINKLKPKLVISLGYEPYKELELQFGHNPMGICDFQLLPTKYNGHEFWHMAMPEYEVKKHLIVHKKLLQRAVTEKPVIMDGNLDGVEYIVNNEDIEPAFEFLATCEYVAMDIETNGIRPFVEGSKILSISLSGKGVTYAFPLFHSQTPESFDTMKVLMLLFDLAKRVKLIAHNLVFELEWLASYLGEKFLYLNTFHDTQAQAYLLNKTNRKGLDACVRRAFGFSLKVISDVDVTQLDATPLEQVLSYNALDTKYTDTLFMHQAKVIKEQKLENAYLMQIDRIPAIALMQIKGLLPNNDFIVSEGNTLKNKLAKLHLEFATYQEVKEIVERQGVCNPFSNKDIPKLFHDKLNVPEYQKSFDEEFLTAFSKTNNHPIVGTLLDLRETNKLYSTYLLPFSKDLPEGGESLYADGLIHSSFNGMKTLTGRLSSDSPNLQNFPSRGGKKYLRNVVTAPPGYIMVATDYGQVEARVAAAMSGDKVLIEAIKTGYDIHMDWALKLMSYLPGFFVEDPDDKAQVKDFRGLVKNQFVFPLLYGSYKTNVCRSLGIPENDFKLVMPIFDEFWQKHAGIQPWHDRLKSEYYEKGYIDSPFGRKYWGPLKFNELINYPVQGAASDIVVIAMSKLARLSVEMDMPDLCPRINIHDDLTFYIREELFNDLMPIILQVMLDTQAYLSWLTVPLVAEVATGKLWGDMKPLGNFSSTEFSPLVLA